MHANSNVTFELEWTCVETRKEGIMKMFENII